jgi:hypothetical protein
MISSQAQENTIDYIGSIGKYNLINVISPDSITAEGDGERFERSEPLGYLGDNYQRLRIHFTSVMQHPEKPLEYLVYGKTKVKNNVCDFQGTITVKEARLYKEREDPAFQQGYIQCEVVLYENNAQPNTGIFRGELMCHFLLDKNGNISYDALMFSADGFFNNSFSGTWTSYKTKTVKKCSWGDYRIPDTDGMDVGAGEFVVNEKYVKNGWESYMAAYFNSTDSPEAKAALKKEEEQWWKE